MNRSFAEIFGFFGLLIFATVFGGPFNAGWLAWAVMCNAILHADIWTEQ